MVSFCTECGAKIEQNFKFCPICGSEVVNSSTSSRQGERELKSEKVNICTNCGEENSLDSKVCTSCGVKLNYTKSETVLVPKNLKSKTHEKPKSQKQNKNQNKSKDDNIVLITKKLESKKILAFVGSSIFLVLIILFASGVIDFSGDHTTSTPVVPQNQGASIDLNSITKINELKSIVEKNPENKAAILELANLRFDSGFFGDAVKNYDEYLKFDPQNSEARIDMAVCYYNLQQFDKAESEIMTALKYSPNHQIGYLNLGIINLAKQNIEKAKEWFKKAVEIDPKSEIGKKAKSLIESH